jgi:hypothetical protein
MVLNNDLGRCSHGLVKKKITQHIQLPGQQLNQLSPEYNSRELLLYHLPITHFRKMVRANISSTTVKKRWRSEINSEWEKILKQ